VGLRPLVKPPDDDGDNTKGLSREHTVLVGRSGLVTVTGGKWTTYRAMAEDVLEKCFEQSLLKRVEAGVTANLQLVGASGVDASRPRMCDAPGLPLLWR
jgi:glycerol-3-phosphate dehydrogenase